MRRVISSTEIVGTCEWQDLTIDVSARSDAQYDEATGTMIVELSADAEPADLEEHRGWHKPGWLPQAQTVKERVSYEEALPEARSVFRSWTRKVRESLPARVPTTKDRRNV